MTKPKEAPKQVETKAAAVAKTNQGSTAVVATDELLANVTGFNDFNREDLSIPFLRILQTLSPQVDEDKPEYVQGAKAGMILNTGTNKLYKDGVIVVPVKYQRELLEWKPREKGGGLAQNYGTDLTPLTTKVVKKNDKGRPVTADGNELVEQGTYYAIVFDPSTGEIEHVVIAMSSTMFKASRAWNSSMQNLTLAKADGTRVRGLAPFAGAYKLTTVKQTKDKYTWYTWVPQFQGFTHELPGGVALVTEAAEFRKSVDTGNVKVQIQQDLDEVDGDDAPF